MPKDIRFYHLSNTPLHKALGELLLKATATGRHALVLVNNADEAKTLDDGLWTFKQEAFLSHGVAGDPAPDKTTVWISNDHNDLETPPNNADMLFLPYGATPNPDHGFDLVCDIFDGQNDTELQNARTRWTNNKENDHTLQYFQQTDKGSWIKKQ